MFKISKYYRLEFTFWVIAFLEVVAEGLQYLPALYVLKPLIPLVIWWMYWKNSTKKQSLFVIVYVLSAIVNVLFIPKSWSFLHWAVIAFLVHRIFFVVLLYQNLTKVKWNWFFIYAIPFFVFFSFLFYISDKQSDVMLTLLLLQNLLITVIAAFAFQNYFLTVGFARFWLFISAIFYVILHTIIYLERFYLDFTIFRPIAMICNVIAFYFFYRFVLEAEKESTIPPAKL
ncbi:MAG: hypothetical protein KGZ81_04270 [Flavobacteriales bacterium]|nr:hypothetical protein [Flavobacteriales bacterium]